jgi:uncharacterized delta-60 repeat protein
MPKSIIFVDSRVADYQSLIDSFVEPAEVFVLDGESDGLAQIAAYLQGRTGIDAIHVISHGSQGALYLGSSVLDSDSLASYQSQLASIGGALTETGDILLYGCNVAQGDVGLQFVTSLAQYTGADVAASSDATGAAALGGDWVLERAVGKVDATPLHSLADVGQLNTNIAPTFTLADGKVTTDLMYADAGSVILQPDGKIVVTASSFGDFVLLRFLADGNLDNAFGVNGKVTTDFGGGDSLRSAVLQPDNKIVAVGSSSGGNYLIARYNTNGSLDTTFDGDGKISSNFGGTSWAARIALQSDNKLLVVGNAMIGTSYGAQLTLARYESTGVLDSIFANNGKALSDFGGGSTSSAGGTSVAQLPSGQILVGSMVQSEFFLTRYSANGSIDSSFVGDRATISSSNTPGLLQPDGKYVAVWDYSASYDANFVVGRYDTNGHFDKSFGVDGKATINFGGSRSVDNSRCIALQSDGKVLVAGYSYDSSLNRYDFAIARLNSDGNLDSGFGAGGKVLTDFGGEDICSSIAQQSDGKIVVAGTASNRLILARYNTDGSLDNTFSPPANTLIASPFYIEGYPSVVLDANVQILDAELSAANSYNSATLTLSRHSNASTQDVFSARYGGTLSTLTLGSYFAVDSVTIGRVTTNGAGTLTLTFNANATQSLVNSAMQQISYANTSDAPPANVQIDWTFNDGNTGAQGTGGALSVTGSTTVQITATNDSPILAVPLVDQTLTTNIAFSYTVPASAFTDPDIETLAYSAVMADGTGMPPWVSFSAATRTFSGTPGSGDIGSLDIRVTAKDSANVSVSDVVRLTVSPPDTAPPTVTSFSPLAEATGVPIGNNIVVTFSEAIAKGIGSIVLKDSTGAAVATYDAATSTNLSISGTTLTINPTTDLAYSSGYSVEIAAGSVKDLAGNKYAGSTSYSFYTSAASTTTNLNFDLQTDASLGGVPVHFSAGSESVVWVYGLTYRVGFSPPRLLGQLSGFSYSSPAKLISEGEFVAVTDGNGKYVLIQVTNAQSINHGGPINGVVFSSFIEPTVSLFSPLDEQVGVAVSSNVVVTFNEPIVQGIGAIVLKTAAGATVATYDAATSSNLSFSGSTLTINPTVDLIYSTGYKVEFAAGTIKDLAGNAYAGTTSYNFTTIATPTQTFTGTGASESFTSGPGNDSIDGGTGTDAVVYSISRSNFALAKTSNSFTLTDNTGANGIDTLLNVERLKFSDGAIALDVGAIQPAGQTALLLGAVLPGRLAFDASKQVLLGAAIDLFDQGYSLQTLSGAVMRLPIWDILTGKATPTSTDIATYLLTNVNGVAPDGTTLATAVAALNTETDFATQGNFLWHLAESSANQTHVGLVGLASTGLAFTI